MRIPKLLAMVAVLLALVAGTAAASPRLSAHPTTVARGGKVTFTGHGCPARDAVFLISRLFPGHAFGVGAIRTVARANGRFSTVYRVRRTTHRGRYGITGRCGGGNLGVLVNVHVT